MDFVRISTAFVIGYASCSSVLFFLSLISFHIVWTPIVGLIFFAAAFIFTLKSHGIELFEFDKWLILPFVIFLVLYVPLIFLPNTAQDDVIYHLSFLQEVLKNGKILHDPLMFNFDLSKLFEMPLLLFNYNDFEYAKVVNVFTSFLLMMVIWQSLFKRMGGAFTSIVVTCFMTFDVVYTLSNSCYVELMLCLSLLLFWLHFTSFVQSKKTKSLYLSCILMSIAVGLKISSLLFAAPFLLYLLFTKKNWRVFITSCLLCLSFAAPWMLRSLVLHHNPFFPLAVEIFPSPHVSLERYVFYNALFDLFKFGEGFPGILLVPFKMLGAGLQDSHVPFMYFTVGALVGFIGLWQGHRMLNLFLFLPFVLAWLVRTHQNRFMLPVVAIGLLSLDRRNHFLRLILLVGIVQGFYSNYDQNKIAFLTGQMSKEEYVGDIYKATYKQVALFNRLESEGVIAPDIEKRIYTIGHFYRGALIRQPVVTNLYYEFEPIINAFSLNSQQNINDFWVEHRIGYLYIFNNYDEQVLPTAKNFNYEAYRNYLSTGLRLVYESVNERVYEIR